MWETCGMPEQLYSRCSYLAFCPSAIAQGPSGIISMVEAAKKPTGGNSREWIYKHSDMTMSASEKCSENGEIFRFFADHRVAIDKCEDQKIVHTTHSWAITQEGQLDIVLRIDNYSYYLLFKDKGPIHSMILRERPGSRSTPTVDREYRLSND